MKTVVTDFLGVPKNNFARIEWTWIKKQQQHLLRKLRVYNYLRKKNI